MTGKEYKLAIRIAGVVDKSFSTSLVAANSTLKKTVSAVDKDFSNLDRGFNAIVRTGGRCFSAVAAAAGVAAAAIGAAVADCTREASEFEHQMSDVTKYVNGLADAAGRASDALALDADGNILNGKTYAENYQEMKAALLDLSTQIPMTAEELTQLAAAAGQSGYDITDIFQYDSDGNIAGFLKDTAVMGTAMDISAEQAGDWAAKWEKAFNMTHEEIMVLADQINYLGANSATTAAEIAQVVNDSASLGQIAGIDVSTTAALADAMLATGVGSDKVATSIKRTITNMVKGTSATKAMKEQWKDLGFTAEGVAIAMQEDSIGTLKAVFEAIGNLPDYKQVAALSTLFGQWAIEGDAKVMGNMKVFQDALDMVGDPDKYSGSMEREFIIKASTSESIDTMVNNAFRAMKISIGDSFLPIKKEYSQKLISFIGEITEKMTSFNDYLSGADGLSRWVQNAETKFPTFQRKFKKFAQPVFSGIMDGGKWIIKHGKGIISVLTGIGAALAAYKAASTITHIVNAIMSLGSLSPVTAAILGVAAAIGLVAGAVQAYKRYEQGLIDDSLAKHFGNIALSMEDLQRIAEEIVGTDGLGQIKEALDAFEDADEMASAIGDLVQELNKANWKVSIGLELTEEEQQSYQETITEYVAQMQEYVLQTQYAVHLNFSAVLGGDNGDIASKVNQFYQDSYEEMEKLGQELSEAVNNAFADKILDPEELQEITNLQAKMAELQASLATSELDANLIKLGEKFKGSDLTAESFMNLQEEVANQIGIAEDAYLESYARNVSAVKKAYDAGYLTQKEYQDAMMNEDRKYLDNMASAYERAMSFQLDTINGTYWEDIEAAIDSMLSELSEYGSQGWYDRANVLLNGMAENLRRNNDFSIVRKSISELLEGMEPTNEGAETLRARYEALGMDVPEWLLEGLQKSEALREIADLDMGEWVWKAIGKQIAEGGYGGYYEDLFSRWEELPELYGAENIPSALMEGIDFGKADLERRQAEAAENAARAYEETAKEAFREAYDGFAAYSQEYINEWCASNILNMDASVKVSLNPIYSFLGGGSSVPDIDLQGVYQNADGGIWNHPILTTFAENGPEAAIPLDGSRNAVSLWEKAGQLLGMGSVFDGLDLDGGGDTVKVEYSPVLNFYGEAPGRDDLTDAFDISQDKFDSMMDRYFKTRSRVSLG